MGILTNLTPCTESLFLTVICDAETRCAATLVKQLTPLKFTSTWNLKSTLFGKWAFSGITVSWVNGYIGWGRTLSPYEEMTDIEKKATWGRRDCHHPSRNQGRQAFWWPSEDRKGYETDHPQSPGQTRVPSWICNPAGMLTCLGSKHGVSSRGRSLKAVKPYEGKSSKPCCSRDNLEVIPTHSSLLTLRSITTLCCFLLSENLLLSILPSPPLSVPQPTSSSSLPAIFLYSSLIATMTTNSVDCIIFLYGE